MNKLNICIDIDGTITDPYYFLPYFNDHFDKNITEEGCNTCKLKDLYDITEEMIMEFYQKNGEEMHMAATLQEGAKEALAKLEMKHNLFFVTARSKEMEHITIDWLEQNELDHIELHSLGSYYKVERAKKLDCDFFLEDNPYNAKELAESGIKVILVDTNYNKELEMDNIIRVKSWKEILEILNA